MRIILFRKTDKVLVELQRSRDYNEERIQEINDYYLNIPRDHMDVVLLGWQTTTCAAGENLEQEDEVANDEEEEANGHWALEAARINSPPEYCTRRHKELCHFT